VLTELDRRTFARTGLVRVEQAFSRRDAAAMEGAVWRHVHRTGVEMDIPETWIPGLVPGMSPELKRKATFQLGWSPAVTEAVTDLLGADWDLPGHCGSVMVTFPDAPQVWPVPDRVWHSDYALGHDAEPLFGIKTFGFIASVAPTGGGTCVISGSHRVIAAFLATLPREVRRDPKRNAVALGRFMRAHPWFGGLVRDDGTADRNERLMHPSLSMEASWR
jgi:hypothetical protein